MRFLIRIAILMLAVSTAHAGSILDYIRNYDLNDYALGVAYSVSESPYVGGESSGFAYPYLTSFRHSAFTDDWLILTGGEAGFRWVNDAGWVLGAVGRVNTQGTGADALEELLGFDSKRWAPELSPVVGFRAWPVHFELRRFVEVFSDFGGPSTELWASLPFEFGRGWFVPSLKWIRNSSERNRYYYGVSANPDFPAVEPYDPGSSMNVKIDLNVGFAITDRWLLSGSVSHEWLASEITDSPVVGRDTLWSGNIGIAYNNDIFRGRDHEGDSFRLPGFEIFVGLYKNNTSSKIIRLPTTGEPPEEISLEDVLGVNRKDDVLHLEGLLRFAHFHRVQFGYFELGRESTTTLLEDLPIGDEIFPAGTQINVDTSLETWRFAYGFSLMNDAQKELGLLVGMHLTKVDAEIVAPDTGQFVESELDTPLPVVGAFGSVALGENTDLMARLEIFRMEFDVYEGSLNAAHIAINHYFTEKLGVGIGYNYFGLNLDSPESGLRGSVELRHYGPILFASFSF
jgi:hypothetical protein